MASILIAQELFRAYLAPSGRGGDTIPQMGMGAKMVHCDCGFMVQSHNENELVKMTQMHVKDTHQQNVSSGEVMKMMKPGMMMK